MQTQIILTFNTPEEAAHFLAHLNGASPAAAGDDWPSQPADERPPWEDDTPAASQPASKPSADPWADEASTTPAASPKAASGPHPEAGKLWPPDGSEYDKETPNGTRHWKFGLPGAPACDCGYPAAQVSGRAAGKKKDWVAWWCPIKFGKNYRDACKFSEFA